MGATALTRVLLAVSIAGCGGSATEPGLWTSETIAGRAVAGGRIALLTTEPALVWIDPATRAIERRPIAQAGESKLWGLGEINGDLYSVAGFTNLVRVNASGRAEAHAALAQPVGNLIDTEDGMAAQYAVDPPGAALLWRTSASGTMVSMPGATRRPLGMSRAEEGVLHLVTCSVPPAPVCWTPGSNHLFWLDGFEVRYGPYLQSVQPIEPARLIEEPSARVIHDALRTPHGTVLVVFTPSRDAAMPALAEFDREGKQLRTFAVREPVRVLLAVREGSVLALARSGRLMEVAR